MISAPFACTIIAIGLIPVAFLFVHANLSGKGKNRIHWHNRHCMGLNTVNWLHAVGTATITLTSLLQKFSSPYGGLLSFQEE